MGLLILGAGEHGHAVKEIARSINNKAFQNISFLDDNNVEAIGMLKEFQNFTKEFRYAFVAIGNPIIRKEWSCKISEAGFTVPILIHPNAYVSPSANISKGCVVFPGAIVQTNSVLGEGVILSSGAIVDHDATIGSYCHINAGAVISSGTVLENNTKIDYMQRV